jgi:RimJ/RimL family protein N-acetyltransferase
MRHSFAPFDAEATRFLSERTRIDFIGTDFSQPQWFCVSGRDDEGSLMGLCLFEFKEWFNAHMTAAIVDRRCLTRRLLRAMFMAVFSQATRITALIEPWNTSALRQSMIMGFRHEGLMRRAVEGIRDAVLFGMLREDCRYLPREA